MHGMNSQKILLEPTVDYGFDYMDIVRDAFCNKISDSWPPNLYPTEDGVREYPG